MYFWVLLLAAGSVVVEVRAETDHSAADGFRTEILPGSRLRQPPAAHQVPLPDDPCLDIAHSTEHFSHCCNDKHEEFPGRKHPKGLPGVVSLQHLKRRKEICREAKNELLRRPHKTAQGGESKEL